MNQLSDILNSDQTSAAKFLKKGSIIQESGDMILRSYYVKKGLLRSYMIDHKGKEHIFMFAPEGWIIADIESQKFDRPAELFIDCLEDSEVIAFDQNAMTLSKLATEQLIEHVSLLSRRVGVLQRRVLMLMSVSAIRRYEHFLEMYPELLHRIPQRMIAAYLGITPEALSKLRGEMGRAKPR